MTGYPPKCPQNGTKHFSDTEHSEETFRGSSDFWPGDTWTDLTGRVWTFQSDGSGWATANLATDQAAE